MVQVRLFSAMVTSTSMQSLEDSMNTFLKQHGNDAIETIQVAAVQSSRLLESEFIGVGLISYVPRIGGGANRAVKSAKRGKKPRK